MSRAAKVAALFAAAVGLVGVAGGQPDPNPLLKLAKAAKGGKLSQDDFLKAFARSPKAKDNPGIGKQIFSKLDANNDGFLTADEIKGLGDKAKQPPPKAEKAAPSGFNDAPTAEQLAFFEKKIRPVLVDNCYKCHSTDADKLRGGLALDTRAGTRAGGDSGAVVVPGSPERSLLVKAIRSTDSATAMPPKGKLPDAVIADLEAWVKMGAPDPRDGAKVVRQEIDVVKGREFWSFQPPKKAAAPAVKDAAWPRSDADRFLLAALEAKGLHPVGDAAPATLIRRVYLDLTGLPPTAEEVEAFIRDSALRTPHSAFSDVVDRLLASPRFGERWGRHWLDVARYAETSGKTANFNFPHAWRYRDYVIASFNADKPYDVFVKEQLAGDLMPSADPKVRAERLVATGFLAIGPKALNERNGIQYELDVADEQIDVTTQAFLGITAACARCHDHKFDPIPQRDYYALAGIFRSTETCYGTVRFVQSQRPSALLELPRGCGLPAAVEPLTAAGRAATEKAIENFTQRMKDTKEPINNIFNAAQIALNKSKLDSFDADGTPKLLAMGAREKPAGGGFGGFQPKGPKGGFGPGVFGSRAVADSPLYVRGEVDKPGDVIPRGFLQVLTPTPKPIRAGSGRKELADWVASRDNPLTARVMVNRVWLNLFGQGLVPTPDNFGVAGRAPTNPALLDSLAVSFVEDGWSVKKLIRRIVLSRAYQLDSRTDARNAEADPDNALVWRMSPRRLDAEALRDSMLSAAGLLDLSPPVGSAVAQAGEGPTARPRLVGGGLEQAVNDPRNNKRSVYLPVVRDNLPEALELFDGADPSLVVSERPTTTVPAQGLFMLNSPFALRVADAAAERVAAGTTADSERVRAAYQIAYSRTPTDAELTTATRFVERYRGGGRGPRSERETWSALMQALLASAEFQYRK